MKKHIFKKAISVLLALFLCVSPLSGCTGQTPTTPTEPPEENETYMQLLGFESYEEITGTKIAIGNMLGQMVINTDKAYITQGDASMKVAVQGDYSKPNQHPYFKLDFLNTTCATCDFTEFKSISVDVYNATDAELHIKLNINVSQEDGNNISTNKELYTLAPNAWTTCTYDISVMAGLPIYDFSSVRYLTVEFMEHKQNREDVPNALYFDNLVGNYWADGEEPETITYDFYEGIDFETAGKELAFYGQGQAQDAAIERVAYEGLDIDAPTNGGSYALRLSHESNYWPTVRINFGETLPAGTVISFVAYGRIDGESLYNQSIFEYSAEFGGGEATMQFKCDAWTVLKMVLPKDTACVDLFWNYDRAQITSGTASGEVFIDNMIATPPLVAEGDFLEGFGFETKGNIALFEKVGGNNAWRDATIDWVAYADAGITAPENGGEYALKLTCGSSYWPVFRINFGKTLKKGTTISFDAYTRDITTTDITTVTIFEYLSGGEATEQYYYNTWNKQFFTLKSDCSFIDLVCTLDRWEKTSNSANVEVYLDNFKAVEPVVLPDPVGDITEGIDFETALNELWFVGTGNGSTDATVERVTYADLGIEGPADGGSYGLKVSHTSNAYPTFRINFGKTLKAGTTITFDAYASTDGSALVLMMEDYEWKQAAYLVNGWRTDLTWEFTLTEDCSFVDMVWEQRGNTNVASYIIIDNIVAVEPESQPEPTEPVGSITEGLDFETAGNELWFVGAGEGSDATIERVSYADLGVTGPANGGSYGLKVSHTTNEYPTFRINFGKTLKAGTQIKFDAYAVTDGSALVLMLQDHGWQQVAYLVNGWRESLNWETTLIEDCDHIDLVWERRGANEVPSSVIIDNIVAVEPEPQPEPTEPVGSITEGLDFETAGNELWFVGTGNGSTDATVERVTYTDLGIEGPADGGSYGLKVSHRSNAYPTFRINFGKTLKAGTTIVFDAYASTDGSAISLMMEDYGWQQAAYLINGWRTDLTWEFVLTEDCSSVDMVWEQRGNTNIASYIIIDNIVAVEP